MDCIVLDMSKEGLLLLNAEEETETLVLDEEGRRVIVQGGCDCQVTDVVEKDNPNPVQSGAVYNHVAEQVGNIEILLGTI